MNAKGAMSLAEKYSKSMAGQWSLRFKTRHPEGDNYDGVVTHVKRDFIVLCEEIDFEFDGVVVLAKKFIKGCRDGRYERCCNEILRENGAIKKCRSPRWLDACDTLPQLIAQIMRRDIWPGVEIMFNEGSESAFYIGPITRADDDRFFLRCYDAAGKWEKNYELSYSEILRIEFDSNYCNHFNSYMRARVGN